MGVQGLADVYCIMRYPFDSKEAYLLNRQIFATTSIIPHLTASLELSVAHREKIKEDIQFNNDIEKNILHLETSKMK